MRPPLQARDALLPNRLGVVPTTWKHQRLKYNSYIKGRVGWQNLRSSEFCDEGPFLVTGMHFANWGVDWDACFHISLGRYALAPEIQLKPGDVLLTKDGSIGKVAYVQTMPGPASLNSHLLVLRPTAGQYLPEYLVYVLGSIVFQSYVNVVQDGTTFFGISQEAVENFPMPLPPIDQQGIIVRFLSRKTARVDALIEKKERLITLLEEKRAALISQAVTKGLNVIAPVKDSGVPWLGLVPAHWELKQLKWAVTLQRGHDLPSEERDEGAVPVVSSCGKSGTHSTAAARGPGIVTGRYGTIGQFYLIEEDYWPLNTTLYSNDLHGNEPRFLHGMLTHLAPLFLLNAVKSAVPGVDRNDVHPTLTAIPPVEEQRAIADFLDHANSQIDRVIIKTREQITKFQEYRTALISFAVTGKIDVRGIGAESAGVGKRSPTGESIDRGAAGFQR